jgi:hypothetical protein
MIKSGKYRGEKILYPDGIGCCIWTPLDEDDDSGLCMDFSYEDIDEIILLLQDMKRVEAEPYEEKP